MRNFTSNLLRHARNIKDLLRLARLGPECLVEMMVERLHWSWHVCWLVGGLWLGGLRGHTWEPQLS